MNAIQLLEHEHQVAKRAFGQIKTAGPEEVAEDLMVREEAVVAG